MISRLLAEAPAAPKAAVHARAIHNLGRPIPARLLSTAAILRTAPATSSAMTGHGHRSSALLHQRFYNSSGAANTPFNAGTTARKRLLSAASGARLVSRAFSTANRPHSAPSPFALPRRRSDLHFYRNRRGTLMVRRGIAATAAPRFVMHALRLPMGALTASLAGLSYAQYKVTGKLSIPRLFRGNSP